jgi:4'-phosphopantetheinyl transferase
MAVCAVSRSGVVGVDVEAVSRDTDLAGLAQRFFAPPEAAAVAAASGLEQREAFFRFWTLKEAYMKARGLGLSLPLDSYAFTLSPAAPPRLTVLQEVARSPEDWQFAELTLDDYRIAVAAETRSSEPFRLRLRETVPLVSAEPWRELPVNETHRWTL